MQKIIASIIYCTKLYYILVEKIVVLEVIPEENISINSQSLL